MKMKSKYICIVVLILLLSSIETFSQSDIFALARTGTVDKMKALLNQSPDAVNQINEDGNSPLIIACYKGNYDVAVFLMNKVKNINYTSAMGTALMAATVKNDVAIVKMLLENRADPNLTDKNGTTALHYAVNFKLYEIAALLMAYHANTELTDSRKKTPFDYAVIADDDKLIQILKSK